MKEKNKNMKKEIEKKIKKMFKSWVLVNRHTRKQIHTKEVHYSSKSNALRHIKNCVICSKYESAVPEEIKIYD